MSTETSASAPDPRVAHRRRLARIWRVVFVIYTLALVTGTHWPRLQLGTEAAPAPDKLIHLVAFGGFAALLWGARFFASTWIALFVAIGYTIIDELTQAIPGLGRSISGLDLTASLFGVVLTFAIGSAFFGLVGGEMNRMRLQARRAAYEQAMARVSVWVALAVAGLVGAAVGLGAALLVLSQVAGLRPFERAVFAWLAIGACGFIAAHVMLVARVRRVDAAQRCDQCGADLTSTEADAAGWRVCPACATRMHAVREVRIGDLPRGGLLRLAVRPAIWCVVTGGLIVGLWTLLFRLAIWFDVLPHFTRVWRMAPLDFRYVVDLGLLGLIGALGAWRFRIGLGRVFDRQDAVCVDCGHDVRYVRTERGVGRCTECGAPFARIGPDPAA